MQWRLFTVFALLCGIALPAEMWLADTEASHTLVGAMPASSTPLASPLWWIGSEGDEIGLTRLSGDWITSPESVDPEIYLWGFSYFHWQTPTGSALSISVKHTTVIMLLAGILLVWLVLSWRRRRSRRTRGFVVTQAGVDTE